MVAGWVRKLATISARLAFAVVGASTWAASGQGMRSGVGSMPSMTGPVSTLPALSVMAARSGPPQAPLAMPHFRRYGVDEGVLRGQVYAVVQDRKGLIWFGSATGLMRYDGVSFQSFRHVADDPRSLPADATYTLYADTDNRIWAGGISSGLVSYDQASARFQQYLHDPADPHSLAGDEVWAVTQTADGQLWVATGGGLDRLRSDGKGFDHVPLDVAGVHAAALGPTRALLAEPDGRLWVGTEQGLFLRKPDGIFVRVAIDPSFHGDASKIWRIDGGQAESNRWDVIQPDQRQDEVRVATEGGLLIIGGDLVARPFAAESLASLRVMSSARDTHGRLWVATVSGILLEERDGSMQMINGQPLLPGGLPSDKIWQIMLDREGGLWVAFEQSSVAYLPPAWDRFARFTHIPDDPSSLTGIVASAIKLARDGLLWVGGNDGWIDKLDVSTGRAAHVVRNMHTQITGMEEDPRGRLWIISPGELHLLDHGKLTAIPAGKARMSRPVQIAASTEGKIYVASFNEGVVEVDPESFAITPLAYEPPSAGAAAADLLSVEQLNFHAGSLWYASLGGFMRWDEATHRLAFVPGVPHEGILIAAFDVAGFWLATSTKITHYRYARGIAVSDDVIDISGESFAPDMIDLQVDRLGRLWVFANPGLFRFSRKTRSFIAFGPSQGLSDADFDGSSNIIAADGTAFAVSGTGITMFEPEQFRSASKDAPVPPPLLLTNVSVRRGNDVHTMALHGGAVNLGWRDRDLRVEARLLSYINPPGNSYRFKLTGFDSGWVDVNSRGERSFAGLPSGHYTLQVMGTGANDVWAELPLPLSITVQAPPWARWWAWLAYLVMVLALAALTLRAWRARLAQRHRLQLMQQQHQLAEAASAAKTQFLATLSHEIRTPMTGVMGMAELLLTTSLSPLQHDYTRAMQRSGAMLLKLLNDALDLARIEAGRLELELASFDPRQLVEDVAQLEQGLARIKGIGFVLEAADDLPDHVVGDAVRIKQVLLNLANNALKFTERGCVTLRAECTPQGLMFSVTDTGPGIPEASQARLFQRFEQEQGPHRAAGTGLGLAICRELVDMMSGSIELQSRLGHGSTFRVRLPLAAPDAVAPMPVAPLASEAGQGGYRLLLVEDDAIIAAVITGLLERQGQHVLHVTNGLAALAELAHARFDALLLDLDLPGVDGLQIARLIRQREQGGQHLPIVAVTARSASEDEVRAYAAGMDGFLRKPITGEELADALARVLARTAEGIGAG